MQSLLSLQDISYSYHNLKGETPALSNISFDVSEGEFLAVVGPSGCGNALVSFWILKNGHSLRVSLRELEKPEQFPIP